MELRILILNKQKETKDEVIQFPEEPPHNPYFNPFIYIWVTSPSGLVLPKHDFLELPFPKYELLSGLLAALKDMSKEVFNNTSSLITFDFSDFLLKCKFTKYFSVVTLSFKRYTKDWYLSQIINFVEQNFRQQYSTKISKGFALYDESNFKGFHQVLDTYFVRPESTSCKKVESEHRGSFTKFISKLLKIPMLVKH